MKSRESYTKNGLRKRSQKRSIGKKTEGRREPKRGLDETGDIGWEGTRVNLGRPSKRDKAGIWSKRTDIRNGIGADTEK